MDEMYSVKRTQFIFLLNMLKKSETIHRKERDGYQKVQRKLNTELHRMLNIEKETHKILLLPIFVNHSKMNMSPLFNLAKGKIKTQKIAPTRLFRTYTMPWNFIRTFVWQFFYCCTLNARV